ncbi:MAG: NAD(P)-dependent alcohol dehydrogenase [Candidatus Bathyarchaeia archaeon]|nr:NAD(P)-dependent alcohol dehydrogenase [Candidatus Bathyarchaeota archaeon]
MKAAILYAPYDIRIEDIPRPEAGYGEVLVRIRAVGICGSDVHFYTTGKCSGFVVKEPLILGHECSGEVVDVGDGVDNVKVGDRVAVEPGFPCGRCYYCRIGRYNLCPDVIFYGAPPIHGAFREYSIAKASFVYRIGGGMSFEEAALIEPLAVGMQAVKRSGMESGSIAAVFGCGPVGLLTIQAALVSGAASIIAIDPVDYRAKLAEELGASYIVNPIETDVVDYVRKLTNGMGVDVVFEASGNPKAFNDALKVVRRGGVVVQIGMFGEYITFDPALIIDKEVDIRGVFRYANVYEQAIRLALSGRIKLKPLITHIFPLDRIKEAFDTIIERRGNPVKVIVKP